MIKEEFRFLNRLSDINNNTGIKFLHPAASPGSHCPLHMALAMIGNIKGVSSLVVGMAECGYYSRFVAGSPYGSQGELHYVYELDSNEVVFGCRKGLKESLLVMEREGAEVIVVIITCVPALIGEDTASVIEELRPFMKAKAVFIDAAHFKRNGYQYGFSATLEQLIEVIDKKTESFPAAMGASVNIFGAVRGKEYTLLRELILENGYEINEYTGRFSFEDLCRAGKAKLSIIFNPKMIKAGKALHKKGIPYVNMAGRYTENDIAEGYEAVFKLLSISDYGILWSGKNSLQQLLQENQAYFSGIPFISVYPELDILPAAVYLCSLGMIPELFHVEEFDEDSCIYKERINNLGQDPYITYITDREEMVRVFSEPVPVLSLGSCSGYEIEKMIPDASLASMSSLCGFERSEELLSLILKTKGGEI